MAKETDRRGTLEEVFRYIEEMFTRYDPRGYGTTARIVHLPEGDFRAIVTRYSCD